ncbi:MAG: protein phosphatase CheZ [Gammaproteobacteria bacterium]|nr:protein phosphatase CheZ [Gammaproteobacteria bacterium]
MIDEQTVVHAKSLVESFEAGNIKEAQHNLENLTGINESTLFKEIGKLTRDLHDTLHNFNLDNRLTSIAAQEIPDAKDRLEYVLSLTANAANKTMDAVEKGIIIADTIKDEAGYLNEGWVKVRKKELKGAGFKNLCDETEAYISRTAGESVELHALLKEALMAQDFQDLTGQVIKRVIQVVQDVEESLVDTIKTFGDMPGYKAAIESCNQFQNDAAGPVIKAEERDDVVQSQDDVDDLLSSLGF